MTIFSLILAFLLEQWHPADSRNRVILLFLSYAGILERYFDTDERRHGLLAWVAAVVPALFIAGVFYYLLLSFSSLLALAWNVLVLYFTLGFRHYSQLFLDINQALKDGDLPQARELLRQWSGAPADELSSEQIARVAIELGLIHSHRYLFGVVTCFVLLPGPLGAVLYRIAELLGERWGSRTDEAFGSFGSFSAKAFRIIDWLPARLTAVSFAIVGNFEDAIYCWRIQAASWSNHAQGIILASGAGALGVRLGDSLQEAGSVYYRPELGLSEKADMDFLQSTIGLIWRALLLWSVLLFLVGIANWTA